MDGQRRAQPRRRHRRIFTGEESHQPARRGSRNGIRRGPHHSSGAGKRTSGSRAEGTGRSKERSSSGSEPGFKLQPSDDRRVAGHRARRKGSSMTSTMISTMISTRKSLLKMGARTWLPRLLAFGLLGFSLAGWLIADEQRTAPDLTVYEWGTFTAIAGKDGRAVEWSPLGLPRYPTS